MNKTITDGVHFDPPAFVAGLGRWSSQDGLPGQDSYDGAANAAFVPSDADFNGCLEMLKTQGVQKLRAFDRMPLFPGTYLKVTARVKAVSGNLPRVRIAGFAATAQGGAAPGADAHGPEVRLAAYGEVVEVSAILGTGRRPGVDMTWTGADHGHVGLDLVGASGGIVRIDDIRVEDVTAAWHGEMMGVVDVRDFGARGDGVADDADALDAADAAAAGRAVLVPEGVFRCGRGVTLSSPVRFEGRVAMAPGARLTLVKDWDFDTYVSAFGGDERLALEQMIAVLYNFSDHWTLDLKGRRIALDRPLDVAAIVGNRETFNIARTITGGAFEAQPSPAWEDVVVVQAATYDPDADPRALVGLPNAAAIPVGARLSAPGVGREVYVREVDAAAGRLVLSARLWGARGRQSYEFRRHQYVLDFSGFRQMSKQCIERNSVFCNGHASAVLLAPEGIANQIRQNGFFKPKDRAITSPGRACQGLEITGNNFESDETRKRAQDRTSLVFNVNANDAKVRDNRCMLFGAFGVMHGSGHLILGNHWFHGDDEPLGVRQAGLVLTEPNSKTTITGNYVDNTTIELTNEHEHEPDFADQFSFGGVSITDNVFTAIAVAPSFRFIRIKPYGTGHFVNGMVVTGNAFRPIHARLERVEEVDTTFAALNPMRARNVTWEGNAYVLVENETANPVYRDHVEGSRGATWDIDFGPQLPFGGKVRAVEGLVPVGPVQGARGTVWAQPHVLMGRGAAGQSLHVKWPEPVSGRVAVRARMDNPL
ncbi:pectate lyase-like protein [Hasllibacter halocynthiae]|uniref:Pectate lyase-like protein n=1 Tax=Hasllibacter halocynthiae TaxID=595589 RepID=A0A2T0X218_9RHOB|nr:glycosyl hydrolase family 28-related protein [Hasllibacter halocynthiae]PRY92957.1 pectate lyase-like protein [Hasllibacter halocynthiae]